jgi:hypothetical protein
LDAGRQFWSGTSLLIAYTGRATVRELDGIRPNDENAKARNPNNQEIHRSSEVCTMPDNVKLKRTWHFQLLALLALIFPITVQAEETKFAKLQQGNTGEKLAGIVGEMVVTAAHPTGKRVGFVRHELKDDPKKENRKVLIIKMEYFGAITGKRYVSDIELKIEVTKTGWEVLDIDYSDNNNIKPSLENIAQLKKKLNKLE